MPFTSLLGQFKGTVRTPQCAKAGLLPGRFTSTLYTTQTTRQQPNLSEWTRLWRPPPIKYSLPPGPVLRELRATTNFTKPEFYDLPNVYYSPLWRHLISKKEHNNRPTARSFWGLPNVDFCSIIRGYLRVSNNSDPIQGPSTDDSCSDTSQIVTASPAPIPQLTLTTERHPAISEASTPRIAVEAPSVADNLGVNVSTSDLDFTHPLPPQPSQAQAPLASTPVSDESVSFSVVPDEWKLETTLAPVDPISVRMLLSILKECNQLQSLSVNLHASSEELDVPIIQADNLKMLSITTSAEPDPIFMALRLPNLDSLSVEWDRSTGQDFPLYESALDLAQLLKTSSSLTSLSLVNVFPPEDDLRTILEKQNMLCQEPTPGDSSVHLPTKPQVRRLTVERRLSTPLSPGLVQPRLRRNQLNISYISGDKAHPELWALTLLLRGDMSSQTL